MLISSQRVHSLSLIWGEALDFVFTSLVARDRGDGLVKPTGNPNLRPLDGHRCSNFFRYCSSLSYPSYLLFSLQRLRPLLVLTFVLRRLCHPILCSGRRQD